MWVKRDFSTAYTNWGASEPNMQHVPPETEVPAYLGLGRHWVTDSQADSKRPYFCQGVNNVNLRREPRLLKSQIDSVV